jgi:Tfp pilus assembly protein FimT
VRRAKSRPESLNPESQASSRSLSNHNGISLIEVLTVVAIIFIVAAIGIPQMVKAIRMSQVRGAADGVAALVQQGRILAERQNTTFSVYSGAVDTGVTGAFVDTTGNGSTWHTGDPYTIYPEGVTNGTSAPSGLSPGFTVATSTTLSFNPLGMASAGVVFYFTDATSDWAAVAVSPLGRTKVWVWNGSRWQ